MVTSSQISERGFYLIRTFRSAFAALADHRNDLERAHIFDVIAGHLRSSSPMSLGAVDAIEPMQEIIRTLGDGARYELHVIDGRLGLYVYDTTNRDVHVDLTAEQAEQLRRDILSVMAVSR